MDPSVVVQHVVKPFRHETATQTCAPRAALSASGNLGAHALQFAVVASRYEHERLIECRRLVERVART